MTGDLRIDTTSSASSTSDGAGISWKETGYGDKFEIRPAFEGADDSNYLAIKTATGGAGTDPDTTDKFKFYPSGRLEVSGAPVNANDVWRKYDFSGGQITNVDLNTLTEQKNYYLAGVSSANHAPFNDFWGVLELIQNPVTMQRITQLGPDGIGSTYTRIYINRAWTEWRTNATYCAISRHSDLPNTVPLPVVTRRGNLVQVAFAQKFPAGSYYNLYNISPAPIVQVFNLIATPGGNNLITVVNGLIRFNSTLTFSSEGWVTGSLFYLTN